MITIKLSNIELIAPCGLNCGLCRFYLRERKNCPGCRGGIENKSKGCITCKIKNCIDIKSKIQFCFQCKEFPCEKNKNLIKRYKTKYKVDILENFESISEKGLEKFVVDEEQKWKCSQCGGTICMHNQRCYRCEI